MNITSHIEKICAFQANRINKRAIVSSSHEGITLLKDLRFVRKGIESYINNKDFSFSYSKGQGNLPSILFLSARFGRARAYNKIGCSMLFDKEGKGIVIGILDAVSTPSGVFSKVARKTCSEMQVDGPKSNTKYSDKFVDFRVVRLGEISDELVLEIFSDYCNRLPDFE